ncbi:MAG TPA: extracellular solute-binding protein, partial [Chloroflexota bacterium]
MAGTFYHDTTRAVSRRRLIGGLGVLAGAGLLTACGTGQSAVAQSASASAGPSTNAASTAAAPTASTSATASAAHLTFWHLDAGSLNKPVQDAITAFQQQYPGITVTLENPSPWNTAPAKYAAAFKADSAADVCQVAFPWTFGFAEQGAIQDISAYI